MRLAARPSGNTLPHVAVYKNTAHPNVGWADKLRRQQREELDDYLAELEARHSGVIGTYEGASAFGAKLRADLELLLRRSFPLGPTHDVQPTPPAADGLALYRHAIERQHSDIELAGFTTRLRVPIRLYELHVPLLRRGRLLLLFDGLDEVPSVSERAQVSRCIERLTRERLDYVPVVTCRFAGYSDEARLNENFPELHVRPLTREQAEAFIQNWYRVVETGLAKDTTQALTLANTRAESLTSRLRESDFRL